MLRKKGSRNSVRSPRKSTPSSPKAKPATASSTTTKAAAPPPPVFKHAARLPLQRVSVVGCGGSGSIFLSHLCRIWQAWTKLGGQPFEITLWDPDVVSEANLARQVFCEADLGQPKALVLAQRMQAFFGLPCKAEVREFKAAHYGQGRWGSMHADLLVGCVDTIAARRALQFSAVGKQEYRQGGEKVEHENRCYWLDLGNGADSGQVVLGGHGLPTVFDVFPELGKQRDKKQEPSCSMAEALAKQDLFINSTLANFAGQLLWQLLRRGGLNHHGYSINLHRGTVVPLPIP